jgi:hypothetical protein
MQKTYKLAKENTFNVMPFGPMLTLEQAQMYQDQLTRAGKLVLVVNMATGYDHTLKAKKGWQATAH